MMVRSKITTPHGVLDSLVFGFIASSPLLIGCIVSLYFKLSDKLITTIMAFGSGALIATLTFSILVEAFEVTHTLPATIIGFLLGVFRTALQMQYWRKSQKPSHQKVEF